MTMTGGAVRVDFVGRYGAVRVYLLARYETEYDDGEQAEPVYCRAYRERAEAQADCDVRNARDADHVWVVLGRVGIPFEGDDDRLVLLGEGSMEVAIGAEGELRTLRPPRASLFPF